MISICMATFNGERYIREQLESIWSQTRKPDEVVIFDDASTDATARIVQQFIVEHGCGESWKLYCNTVNLGYPASFYRAMDLCGQDIVFLADQDDVWDVRKLEVMASYLEKKNELAVLSCCYGLIDKDGNPIKSVVNMSDAKNIQDVRLVSVSDIFRKYQWPGMVLAYRRYWYERQKEELKLNEQIKIPHDILICSMAAEQECFGTIGDVLAWHRRHENNTAKEEHRISKLLRKDRKVQEIQDYCGMLDGFFQAGIFHKEATKQLLHNKYRSLQDRLEALQSGSVLRVWKNARKNREYTRMATLICDLVIVFLKKG